MKCQICGRTVRRVETDLPFKISATSIVILKKLPVLECENCQEFLIEDSVMEQVDKILSRTNSKTELEVVYYAA